jgi:lysophospholipase L1-like esterase
MRKYGFFKIFKYAIIFIFCIIITSICSCNYLLKKAEKLSSNIPFNYPGLRIETKSININEIENYSPRIVCFGDSVNFGWNFKYEYSYPSVLEKLLKKDYPNIKIINSGVGGNTIIDGNQRFIRDVSRYKPNLVIINFGLNDGMLSKISKNKIIQDDLIYYEENNKYFYPNVNLKEFEERYENLLKNINKSQTEILILSINPVLDIFPDNQSENYRKKQKEIYWQYNEKIIEIAKNNKINYINLWDIFSNEADIKEYIQADGIHPNKAGLLLIASKVYKKLEESKI